MSVDVEFTSGPRSLSVVVMPDLAVSPARRTPPAAPTAAAEFFASRLAFQADVSDVQASLAQPDAGFVLLDSRSRAGWTQGHVPGAIHLPTAEIPQRARQLLDVRVPVITYCWGPGCDGATRSALALARLGFSVKEMLGGIEYWIREGFPVHTAAGLDRGEIDPLTAPRGSTSCAC